jgi:hypothetical protein
MVSVRDKVFKREIPYSRHKKIAGTPDAIYWCL